MVEVLVRRLNVLFKKTACFIFIALLLFGTIPGKYSKALASENSSLIPENIITLQGPWQYQWGWQENKIPTTGWQKVEQPVNPPGRSDQQFLWLKISLPSGNWDNPSLLIDGRGVLLGFKAYLADQQIYEFGDFNENGLKKFPGISPHLIELGDDPANAEVILLVCSDYSNIGIRGTVKIGSKFDLLLTMIQQHFIRFLIGAAIIFLGLFELSSIGETGFKKKGVPYFSILALCLGFYTINATNIKDLLINDPILWFSIYYLSLVIMPAALIGLFKQIVFPKFNRILKYLILFHVFYAAICFSAYILALLSLIPNTVGYGFLNILRIIFIIELLFFAGLMMNETFVRQNNYAVIYLVGFIPIIFSGIRDILIGLGKINSSFSYAHVCILIFISALWLIKKQMHTDIENQLNRFSKEIDQRTKEKQFLLKDLHDGVGGLITTIKFLAEMAGDRSYQGNTGKMLSTITDLSRDSITEIRRFISSLDEKETDWDSLSADFRQFGKNMVESLGMHFEIRITVYQKAPKLNTVLYLNLFRIYKEALTNIVRHARAKKVQVTLEAGEKRVTLEVSDDGQGIKKKKKKGRGLANMQTRASEMGGDLEIESGKGTRIKIMVPHIFL